MGIASAVETAPDSVFLSAPNDLYPWGSLDQPRAAGSGQLFICTCRLALAGLALYSNRSATAGRGDLLVCSLLSVLMAFWW